MLKLTRNDQLILEAIIPAHMMFLTYEAMKAKGWEIRADVLKALNLACVAPFAQMKAQADVVVQVLAKRADEVARVLLRKISDTDERHGLLDCCAFCLLLGNEKLLEPDSQSILVALALMEECRLDEEAWGYTEKKAYAKANAMLFEARRENCYKPLGKIIPVDFGNKSLA